MHDHVSLWFCRLSATLLKSLVHQVLIWRILILSYNAEGSMSWWLCDLNKLLLICSLSSQHKRKDIFLKADAHVLDLMLHQPMAIPLCFNGRISTTNGLYKGHLPVSLVPTFLCFCLQRIKVCHLRWLCHIPDSSRLKWKLQLLYHDLS